jgi:hypothetical protein
MFSTAILFGSLAIHLNVFNCLVPCLFISMFCICMAIVWFCVVLSQCFLMFGSLSVYLTDIYMVQLKMATYRVQLKIIHAYMLPAMFLYFVCSDHTAYTTD